MSFDERAALEITAVRALEGPARAPEFWTEADSAWASGAAAELVGESGKPQAFLHARARLALERIADRFAAFPRLVRTLRWRTWIGVVIVAGAFLTGVAIDEVGGSHRVNLLAPPFFSLLAWNVGVYAALALGFIVRYGEAAAPGPIRRAVTRLAGGRPRSMPREIAAAVAEFAGEWARLSAPLYRVRAARVLHLAATSLAVGLVCGLYVRGIAFEYRATWESTFLSARAAHTLLATALAPGSAISRIPIPTLEEVEAIRAPAAENAARWLHLIAVTVALVVILPRLVLALGAWLLERHRSNHMPLALDAPYFARLLRGFRGGPMRARVVPYSYTLPQAEAAGLESVLRRVFGANASLTIAAPVTYGGEEALTDVWGAGMANTIALFNAAATPEPAAHGSFLDALKRQTAPGGTLVALIDESALRERWGDEPARLEQRRAIWRAPCADRHIPCVFLTLRASDLANPVMDLEHALEEAAR